ncbi:MAG: hypothetical protein LAP61_05700 [Acidobacteriia bacterium]|nr:hypothetical protein [Terriglobia bacterium]
MIDRSKALAIFLLSMLVVGGFIFDVYMVLSGKLDTTDAIKMTLIGNVMGQLQGMASLVLAYYFGNTKSSSDKDTAMVNMAAVTAGTASPLSQAKE